jgi:ABC-2 type transport system ATP-binding protein
MIGQLAAEGKTILISSHILTELAEMCHLVGIVEKGKLLATGTVEEIRHHHADPHESPEAELRVRVLARAAELGAWLEARHDIDRAVTEGDLVRFPFPTDRSAQAVLLREILQAGFDVVEFGMRTTSLEDVFLRVTRGEVQ